VIRRSGWFVFTIAATIVFPGCAADSRGGKALPDSAAAVRSEPEPPIVATLVAVPVIGFTGPGGKAFETSKRTSGSDAQLHRQIGMRVFDLPLRRPATSLRQYPCATCHQGAAVKPQRGERFHGNIRLQHPSVAGGACTACHIAGAVDRLALADGDTATLDQAYRLCAQCHFAQANAWAAGAHGKRLVAWGGRRVVMNCTDCHDPHRPGVESRLPFAGPRIRRTSGVSQ